MSKSTKMMLFIGIALLAVFCWSVNNSTKATAKSRGTEKVEADSINNNSQSATKADRGKTFEDRKAIYLAKLDVDTRRKVLAMAEKDLIRIVEMFWKEEMPEMVDDATTDANFLIARAKFPPDVSDYILREWCRKKSFDPNDDEAIAKLVKRNRASHGPKNPKTEEEIARYLQGRSKGSEAAFAAAATNNQANLLAALEKNPKDPMLAYAAWISSFENATNPELLQKLIDATDGSSLPALAKARQALLLGDLETAAATIHEAAAKNLALKDYTWDYRAAELAYYTDTKGWTLSRAVNELYNTDPLHRTSDIARSELSGLNPSAAVANSASRFWEKSPLGKGPGVDDMRLAALQTLYMGGESQEIWSAYASLSSAQQYMKQMGAEALDGKLNGTYADEYQSVKTEIKTLKSLAEFQKEFLRSANEAELKSFITDAQTIGERAAVEKRLPAAPLTSNATNVK